MKFRKKPVVIDAVRWIGDNAKEVADELGLIAEIRFGRWTFYDRNTEKKEAEQENESLLILTLEGEMEAKPGDWIIKGVQGELYPCKPDIFNQTYEKAED